MPVLGVKDNVLVNVLDEVHYPLHATAQGREVNVRRLAPLALHGIPGCLPFYSVGKLGRLSRIEVVVQGKLEEFLRGILPKHVVPFSRVAPLDAHRGVCLQGVDGAAPGALGQDVAPLLRPHVVLVAVLQPVDTDVVIYAQEEVMADLPHQEPLRNPERDVVLNHLVLVFPARATGDGTPLVHLLPVQALAAAEWGGAHGGVGLRCQLPLGLDALLEGHGRRKARAESSTEARDPGECHNEQQSRGREGAVCR
mmetsp:Transcript_41834/g.94419  ORF Transcript_41834/g.94419 Transcript_41834/m.94419 type:complete len:253 (-) Transcript_41834:21-779(-)